MAIHIIYYVAIHIINATTTRVIKQSLKKLYFMSNGNACICIAEPNLEVLPFA